MGEAALTRVFERECPDPHPGVQAIDRPGIPGGGLSHYREKLVGYGAAE